MIHRKVFLWGVAFVFLSFSAAGQPAAGGSRPPAQSYDTALFRIIRSGDMDSLRYAIGEGAGVNAVGEGMSALMAATLYGTPAQMRFLLDHGAVVNFTDADSITALWLAVPDMEKTRLLLEHGANPRMLSRERYSVLVKLANFPGVTNVFRLLIEHGADPKKSAPDNMLLYEAASTNDTSLVGLLLRLGFRANDTVSFGDYPLNSALLFRCFNTVKMLVDSGANVNVCVPSSFFPNMHGMTALMLAGQADDEASFFYLLEHGADVHARSKKGYTTLMYLQTAERDHPDMTKALLAHGASVSDAAPDGETAFSLASKKGKVASLAYLIK